MERVMHVIFSKRVHDFELEYQALLQGQFYLGHQISNTLVLNGLKA